MITLVDFLEARLAEDEAWALAASAPYEHAVEGSTVPPGGVHWTWVNGEDWSPLTADPAVDDKIGGRDLYGCDVNLASVERWPLRRAQPEIGQLPRTFPRAVAYSMVEVDSAAAGHIVRHDPARVLREVEAKRKAIETHRWHGPDGCAEDQFCPLLTSMAAVWADHPDYQAEWSPS